MGRRRHAGALRVDGAAGRRRWRQLHCRLGCVLAWRRQGTAYRRLKGGLQAACRPLFSGPRHGNSSSQTGRRPPSAR
eukprot:355797-Chlamydomonas_euryale.AAC.9